MKTGTPGIAGTIQADRVVMAPAKAEQVASVTCEAVLNYFEQPGVQEKFEAWLAERKKRKEEKECLPC